MSSPSRRTVLPVLVATAVLVTLAVPVGTLAGGVAGATAGDAAETPAVTGATVDARSGGDRAVPDDDRASADEGGPRAVGTSARAVGVSARAGTTGSDPPGADPSVRRSDGRVPSADGIRVDHDLRRVPEQPGVVEVRAVAHLPDSVTRFELTPPEGADVRETTGFEEGGEKEAYSWDESTANPSVTYRLPINRTSGFGSYDSVDVGQWALVDHSVVDVSFHYWFDGSDPGYEEVVTVADGETGYAGDELTYLGDHAVRTDEGGDPTVRFVVAGATEMAADRETAAATIRHAAGSFDVARAPDPLTVFVVPAPATNGLQPGGTLSEFLVRGDVPVAGPESTWTHEYVHTRQLYLPTESMAWLDEATAEYYGALLSMQAGTTSYRTFRREVTNDQYAGVDLTAPDTWPDSDVEYDEGARVVAALDARIRAETGGEKTFMDVFERINEFEGDPTREKLELSYAKFKRVVRDVTGTRLGAYVDAIVTGDGGAEVPDDPYLYTAGPTADADGDNLTAAREREAGTNPFEADSDRDGLGDASEVDRGTNGTLPDTDGDGLDDGRERELGTDPLTADTDGDGLDDASEVERGTDPAVADTDGDGLADGRERALGTDPTVRDTDGDGLSDRAESAQFDSDPTAGDTDGDGLADGRELEYGTDPTVADSDGDGLADGREVELGSDPTRAATDTATADPAGGSTGADGPTGGTAAGDAGTGATGPTPLAALLVVAVACGALARLVGRR